MKERKKLTFEERLLIYTMRRRGSGIREIARAISRCASIVSRELRRNQLPQKYQNRWISNFDRARYADFKAKERLRTRRRCVRKCQRWNHHGKRVLELLIEEQMSPEQISMTLKKEGVFISASTIYRMCNEETKSFRKFLPRRGRPKRRKVTRSRVYKEPEAVKRHISERPEAAKRRSCIGHYEMDTIHSRRGTKGGVLSIIDRCSREKEFILLPDLKAATTGKAIVEFLHSKDESERLSITFDNGSEFQEWPQLEKIFPELKAYFCDAYASHQKGSVERANQDFRRFVPKGSDISRLSEDDIKIITQKINRFPLKLLGGLTPQEYYEHHFQSAA